MRGVVRSGINNIYTVDVEGKLVECRIKGKQLKGDERLYNPIAVGDQVIIETDPYSQERGYIIAKEKPKNSLQRWNKNKKCVQTIASNIDHLVIISSVAEPPFRPRFIDRMLVSGLSGGVDPIIVVNKCDLEFDEAISKRLAAYRACGYTVLLVSARTGEGIDALKKALVGKITVFAGQSGVGKTSILNKIKPELALKVGEISLKYDRGVHTTNSAVMISLDGEYTVIDTPGIRELDIAGVDPDQLRFYFPELTPLQEKCLYPSCLHHQEPGCAVKEAVERGLVDADRYESYLRILVDLEEKKSRAYD